MFDSILATQKSFWDSFCLGTPIWLVVHKMQQEKKQKYKHLSKQFKLIQKCNNTMTKIQ